MQSEGQAVRVVPCTLVLACLLIGSNGCQLFSKKSNDSDNSFVGAKNTDKPKATKPSDPLAGGAGGVTDLDGILAGRVIDAIGQPADAQIRWVCTDGSKQEEVPLDVAVNAQGYFMIQGLKSGKHYKLITHARSGDKMLEVVTLTQAPDVHLLIQVNEKFAVPVSPDKGKSNSDKGKKSTANAQEQPASAQIAVPAPGWQQPGPTMLPPVPSPIDKSKIADQGGMATRPPLADWKWQGPPEVPTVAIAAPVPQSPFSVAPGPAPVPSSVKVGRQLENFALYDLDLQPWELKKQSQGKLLLLDFWKTNCPQCLQEIRTLKVLKDQFGPAGLQIVGIAYEEDGTLLKQAQHVTAVTQQRGTNYPILLGGGPSCPLKGDLQIRVLPTLVLLDENGVVVWRHEQLLEPADRADLEFAIKRRLLR
jgi:thiol-disulfide isomerase/thioredoxin